MLETELKKLTAAIYELNATLEAMGGLPTPTPVSVGNDEPKHSGKSVKDVVEEAVGKKVSDQEDDVNPSAHTVEGVRSMALAVTRADRSKQRDIKAKLAEHNAKLATDLKGEDLQVFGDWLKSIKEELEA